MSEADVVIGRDRQREGPPEPADPAHWHGLFDALRQRERRTRMLHDEQPLLVLVVQPETRVIESVNAYGARLLE